MGKTTSQQIFTLSIRAVILHDQVWDTFTHTLANSLCLPPPSLCLSIMLSDECKFSTPSTSRRPLKGTRQMPGDHPATLHRRTPPPPATFS